MEANKSLSLSTSEQYIVDNKADYVKLHEEGGEDVTQVLFSLAETLQLGQMVHTSDFNLEETMNSVELDHFKMDSHYNLKEAQTYRKLIRENKIKRFEDLNLQETLSLIDNLMIKEMMWLNGSPIYQTIFNLVYFTENDILKTNQENVSPLQLPLFKIFLDSTLHLIYLTYSKLVDCTCLREEDVMMIPIQNVNDIKRDYVLDALKSIEKDFKNKLKSEDENTNKSLLNSLLLRIKLRICLITIVKEQFDFTNKKRYNNLNTLANSMKNIVNEIKGEIESISENVKLTDRYFCSNLCRIAPTISSIKILKEMNFSEAFLIIEKLTNNLISVSRIYDSNQTDFSQIAKSVELINNESPSFLIRAIIELNLFPENKLLGNVDYSNLLFTYISELKVTCLDEKSELMGNITCVYKEIILKNLKNKTRQVRDTSNLFEGISYLILESNQLEKGNKKEKKVKSKTPILPTLTNLMLRSLMQEMLSHVWMSFELGLFASFELDYVFYLCGNILEQLCTNTNVIVRSFAEKILKEEDMAKSTLKKKLPPCQKTILDEIYIYNALRCAIKGLALTCRYMKVYNLLPHSEKNEQIRVTYRFPAFKSCKFFLDMTYETFLRDTQFDLEKEKEMILQSADSYMKQSIKYLNELKGADLKLRDAFHYSNSYIENLSKVIITNNLFLSKIRKNEKTNLKVAYTKKYDCFLPVLELSI